MKTVKRIEGFVYSLALTALLLITLNAMGRSVMNVHVPVSGTVFNPCNGEIVRFNGMDHFTAHLTFDGAGGFHATSHDNIHVTGTGSLGNSYQGNQEVTSKFNGHVGVEQTFVLTFSEISQGSAPNFRVHIVQHVIVNADGTVRVFFTHFTANCRA